MLYDGLALPASGLPALNGGHVFEKKKKKIRDSQADQKVLGNWVEVRGLPETMGKMAVRELLHSISATGLKDITIREGRWRVGVFL